MTKPGHRQLIVLLCALLLLVAQQAAFVHLIGHFSFAAESVTQQGNEDNHGSESNLAHGCTTCLAFTALAAAAPLLAQLPAMLSALAETPLRAEFPWVHSSSLLPYAARAPPIVL
ncbi:MAG: hypothetical protein PHQ05_09280 [Sterolibacterium sp.]|nr:hypothetical protein [Sterolibacterium sp.]